MNTAKVNAGRVLIQSKQIELKNLMTKFRRSAELYSRWVAQHKKEQPAYTEENMETLALHVIHAVLVGDLYMVQFWAACCTHVKNDLDTAIKREIRFRHQVDRVVKIVEAYRDLISAKGAEIQELYRSLEQG
jgi:hypothetical protein